MFKDHSVQGSLVSIQGSLKIGDYPLVFAKEDHCDECAFGTEQVVGNLRPFASQDRVSINLTESVTNFYYS